MLAHVHNAVVLILAQAAEGGGGGAKEEESGSFLVSPSLGLMLWTLAAFLVTMWLLRKLAFPRIAEALDKRQRAIDDSIDAAERTRREADELLAEYRERLQEARQQAEDIVSRARKAAENAERESLEKAKGQRDELMEQTRRDIEQETRRAIQEIRREVGDLTVLATEKVIRKSLSEEDQRKLVDEALSDIDFSTLAGGQRANGEER
jgi:F-type H+-transporting ATPase subunit b